MKGMKTMKDSDYGYPLSFMVFMARFEDSPRQGDLRAAT